ncbi:MAG: hypothetical protein AAF804_04005 [Bacteroidota bacterium]
MGKSLTQNLKPVYLADAIGWGEWEGKTGLVFYYRLGIDLELETMVIYESQVRPFKIR